MTVPHQSFDNVRLLVGNLHMHGGLVSAGRIDWWDSPGVQYSWVA